MAAVRVGASQDAQPGSLLLVVHNFVARSADELSLAKGDRIELIERDDDFGDGWFLGRHMTNGRTGLFPEVYTTPAPKGTLASTNQSRRASEGPPKTTTTDENVQQRHVSTSVMPQQPAGTTTSQQTSLSAMAQALRTAHAPSSSASRNPTINTESPVMNETLSVIDEHMNDMGTPRSSFINGERRDSASLYSTQALSRVSYIAGHETDEEEHQLHTEDEVMSWTPSRVAEYLEDNGVEKSHCDVFREQEITGEVLLAMDQSSVFIKEFELGSVGRRLKTWHKVKALQDEVKASTRPEPARTEDTFSSIDPSDGNDIIRTRSSTVGSTVPRALETSRQSAGGQPVRSNTLQNPSQTASASAVNRTPALSPQNTPSMTRAENTYRPSAQVIREMQGSRRHSSIDSTKSFDGLRTSHRKQPSLDSKWQMGQPQTNGRPSTSHGHTLSSESVPAKRDSSMVAGSSPMELDRGYFSSNEVDGRSTRPTKNVLRKTPTSGTGSPLHSRTSSFQKIVQSDSVPDLATPGSGISTPSVSTPGAINTPTHTRVTGLRSMTSPQLLGKSTTTQQASSGPVVTKLDPDAAPSLGAVAASSTSLTPKTLDDSSASATTNTSGHIPFFGNKLRATGLRTISDAITNKEKSTVPSPVKEDGLSSPRSFGGSSTPSTESQSIEKGDTMSRTSQSSAPNLVPPPTNQRRPRTKSNKKLTSAYTRGLEKKSPAEQMITCDYSGWMKKKSGSLMTTWKPRLFILRGRRLSYYYADSDTEEKGLIDISFHRVLPAHNETITGLHAAVTGAAASPTSPKESSTPTLARHDLAQNPPKPGDGDDEGLFIFKLVPPKTGLSKAVNFTKPTVHYFAVNSRQEGRLWMAALMKATIDRDEAGLVTTTYSQKTISLAKARARRERPPALRDDEADGRAELASEGGNAGLGIENLDEKEDAAPGAEEASVGGTPSPAATATDAADTSAANLEPIVLEEDGLSEKEREAVALNDPY